MRWLALVFLLMSATVARAETAVVKSGEHEGFSRLVLTLDEQTDWQFGRTADGYELRFARTDIRFDLSTVFDYIPRDRLSAIWADPLTGSLRLGIGCACYAVPFEFRPNILVIDLRSGQPPEGSSFELALDGSAVIGLADRPVQRPRQRPLGVVQPDLDWRAVSLASAQVRKATSDQPVGLSVIPIEDPRIAAVRDNLLRELGRAATQGLIEVTEPIQPRAERNVEQTVATVAPSQSSDVTSPNSSAASHFGDGKPLTALGSACIGDASLDIGTWADDRPYGQQIAEARTSLLGEFDRLNPDSLEQLLRLYLHFGFGAEARTLPHALGFEPKEGAIYEAMATIMDHGSAKPRSPFEGMSGCDTAAALWAVLAKPKLEPSDRLNTAALLRSFSGLPPHLRRQLGPHLSERFLDAGDIATARTIADAILRSPGNPGDATRMLTARIGLATGDTVVAESGLAAVIVADGSVAPEAMIELTRSQIARGEVVEEAMLLALAAMAYEHQGTDLGVALTDAQALAEASAGQFVEAFETASALAPDASARIWAILAERGDDQALLEHGVLSSKAAVPNIPTETRYGLMGRLLGLGLAESALIWSSGPTISDPEERLLVAEAELTQRDPRSALRTLAGLEDQGAERLRAAAYEQLGEPEVAAAAFEVAGDSQSRLRAAWRAQDWALIERDGASPQREAIATLLSDPASVPSTSETSDGPLARSARLLEESASARAAIAELLVQLPAPQRPTF